MTHIYALLPISPAAYEEISQKLRAAGYAEAFDGDGVIDMHGLAVVIEQDAPEPPADGFDWAALQRLRKASP
jgi:hypothetical protein